ncbi:MAG: SCO7613 C-terminal domain-containing membrane protein [Nocardioides sp.]
MVHLRATQPETSAMAGAVLTTALAGSTWTWGQLAGVTDPWAALLALVVLAVAVVPAHLLPDRTWSHPNLSIARAGLEVGAAMAALPVALAGVLGASDQLDLTWTAVYLTVTGVAVTSLSLLRPDRQWLLPLGGLLLAAASWVQLWEVGVREPEPYTLPSAAVLAVVGLVYLRRHPQRSTSAGLGPALGMALVPSLLWALTEDAGLRALLLGAACLGLVVAGTRLHWTAPMTWGAAVGGILAVRLAAPYVGDALPRWVLIGGAGTVLIVMGVTWERRLLEARQMLGYVRRLR